MHAGLGAILDAHHLLHQADARPCGARAAGEDVDQIGAVDEMVVAVAKRAKVEAHHLAALVVAQTDSSGLHGPGAQRVGQAEGAQHGKPVGADLQTRADLGDLGGLFQHADHRPAPRKRARHRQPADAGTDHADPEPIQFHDRLSDTKTPGD